MQQEYGGYFGMEPYTGNEYHQKALALNTGRNCLEYLIKAYKIETIWLPSWLCDAILQPCIREGLQIRYYSIDPATLAPILPVSTGSADWVYIINYYGLIADKDIADYRQLHPHLIIDNAQAFFRQSLPHTNTLYSCRKFFGVTDGAYLYTESQILIDLLVDTSNSRMQLLAGRTEEGAQAFYKTFQSNEAALEHEPPKWMSQATHNILRSINYESAKQRRNENFARLHRLLAATNQLQLPSIEGAYMYPFLHSEGARLRTELIRNKVFVPVLWPNCAKDDYFDQTAHYLSKNLVSLPCDQRYTPNDMEIIYNKLASLL